MVLTKENDRLRTTILGQLAVTQRSIFMNISCRRNNVANDCAGKQGEARKKIYSKISMKFLGGSAVYTTYDNACSYADRHVGGEAPRTRCTSGEISHYAFLSGGRHYFTYCRRRRTARRYRLPLPIFPAWQKGTAGNLVPGICVRVCIQSP